MKILCVCVWGGGGVEGKYGINQLGVNRSPSGQYHWHLLKQIDNIWLKVTRLAILTNQKKKKKNVPTYLTFFDL